MKQHKQMLMWSIVILCASKCKSQVQWSPTLQDNARNHEFPVESHREVVNLFLEAVNKKSREGYAEIASDQYVEIPVQPWVHSKSGCLDKSGRRKFGSNQKLACNCHQLSCLHLWLRLKWKRLRTGVCFVIWQPQLWQWFKPSQVWGSGWFGVRGRSTRWRGLERSDVSLLEYKYIRNIWNTVLWQSCRIPCCDNHASRERELDKDRRCGWKGRNPGRSSKFGSCWDGWTVEKTLGIHCHYIVGPQPHWGSLTIRTPDITQISHPFSTIPIYSFLVDKIL